ncbi:phosphonate C-P lyase system protein PhnG [Chthonobacter albigriseus]|uniref:phosphonate C-P lyase system protein PhnG n=1 Tax=Chthonobacter albigriseus TaxID=1683161 RepID=UPI0015EED212|nr:phosphonate C-P lyase system protein PhnG [Chthonobacter albigriseus]
MLHSQTSETSPPSDRRAAMALLAQAPRTLMAAGLEGIEEADGASDVRAPEIGLVMVRGRMGGGGRPFNLGEATVTRCTVRLPDGTIGVAHLLGRDRARARLAAICDALWQRVETREAIEARVLAPVREARAAEDATVRAETAATRVDFFTMVRGED